MINFHRLRAPRLALACLVLTILTALAVNSQQSVFVVDNLTQENLGEVMVHFDDRTSSLLTVPGFGSFHVATGGKTVTSLEVDGRTVTPGGDGCVIALPSALIVVASASATADLWEVVYWNGNWPNRGNCD